MVALLTQQGGAAGEGSMAELSIQVLPATLGCTEPDIQSLDQHVFN